MRALVAALALALVTAGCSGSDDPPTAEPTSADPSPSESTSESSGPAEVTELDAGPVGVADVGGEAWTVLLDDGTVRTGDDTRIDVGNDPLRIVDTPDGAWVSVISDGTIVRINPATGKVDRTVTLKPAGSEPEGLAWDGTNLWVVDQAHDRVVALDADGGHPVGFRVDDEPRLVSAGTAGVFVANYRGSSVSRVRESPQARGLPSVTTAPLVGCVGPQGIAQAGGKVWIACTLSSKVVALDPDSLKQVVEIPDVADADAVVADGDTVYAVGQSGPTVWVIDAASGKVRDTIVLSDAMATRENVSAAIVGADLVVTHPDEQKIYTLPIP